MQSDAEWGWIAEIYRDVPAARLDAITGAVGAAERSLDTQHRTRASLLWAFGAAAAIAAVLLGYRLVKSGSPAPVASSAAGPGSISGPAEAPSTVGPATVLKENVETLGAPAGTPPLAPAKERAGVADVRPDTPATALHPQFGKADDTELADLPAADLERLRLGLGDQGLRDFAMLMRDTKREGLPREPLLDRALAGVAHAAPSSAILATVTRRVASLRQARRTLGASATTNELTAGADALEAGVTASQLSQAQRLFSPDRTAAGLLALAGLVAEGIPAPVATAALEQGIDAGASDATLLALRAAVTADVARGVPPLTALRARVERLGGAVKSERQSPSPVPTPRLSPTGTSPIR